jgi:hypothetical protein
VGCQAILDIGDLDLGGESRSSDGGTDVGQHPRLSGELDANLTKRVFVTSENWIAWLVTGVLSNPINVTEKGNRLSATDITNVWTGTRGDGQIGATCSDWTTDVSTVFGTMGSLHLADGKWTDNGGPGLGFTDWGCQSAARLYCFEL